MHQSSFMPPPSHAGHGVPLRSLGNTKTFGDISCLVRRGRSGTECLLPAPSFQDMQLPASGKGHMCLQPRFLHMQRVQHFSRLQTPESGKGCKSLQSLLSKMQTAQRFSRLQTPKCERVYTSLRSHRFKVQTLQHLSQLRTPERGRVGNCSGIEKDIQK